MKRGQKHHQQKQITRRAGHMAGVSATIGAPRQSHTALPGIRRDAAKLLRALVDGNKPRYEYHAHTQFIRCGKILATFKDLLELAISHMLKIRGQIAAWPLTHKAIALVNTTKRVIAQGNTLSDSEKLKLAAQNIGTKAWLAKRQAATA